MNFLSTPNLTQQSLAPCVPWEFTPSELPSEKIRKDKVSRQEWYRNVGTQWNYYTGLEPSNPNIRVSKENPPRLIHAFVADYDISVPDARINEAVELMKIKPSKIERSLGGNFRLLWFLQQPFKTDGLDFTLFLLQRAQEWLALKSLPGLDEGAFTDPARLLCNGATWRDTGQGPINEAAAQAFFIESARKFDFKGGVENDIPLEAVEKQLKDKYPSFSWPTEFNENSQGPSFWIAGSTSPMSAIVKKSGIISFAAHAEKPFYTWADLLGKDWVKQYGDDAITKATDRIYWDSKSFWRRKKDGFAPLSLTELTNYFKTQCKLSFKAADGSSPADNALNHIYSHNYIHGAAPFVFQPSGELIRFNGNEYLNIYVNRPVIPASELTPWGNDGGFKFLSYWHDNLFDPAEQLKYALAWWRCFYESALNKQPMPGQNLFLMGGAGVGKTLWSRKVVALSVGGFSDASAYLVKGETFNSHLLEFPVWSVDDDTVSDSSLAQAHFASALKKMAANQQHLYNKKFCVPSMVEWMGRGIITTNLDYVSSRILAGTDNTSLDKTCIFKASATPIKFPPRAETEKIIARELPYFLRWLLDWTIPADVELDVRYGIRAYHENSLLDMSHQTSRMAPFKELLIETMNEFFVNSPEKTFWRGSLSQLFRLIASNPMNDSITRSWKLEQVSRYLEQIQREGLVKCETETGDYKTRVWIFYRREVITVEQKAADPIPPVPKASIFSKP